MTPNQKNPDITVRGGLINIPSSAKPLGPARHRPNTPVNKKTVKPRADHQPYAPGPDPNKAQPKTPPAAPPKPAVDEPDGDQNHESVETSEGN